MTIQTPLPCTMAHFALFYGLWNAFCTRTSCKIDIPSTIESCKILPIVHSKGVRIAILSLKTELKILMNTPFVGFNFSFVMVQTSPAPPFFLALVKFAHQTISSGKKYENSLYRAPNIHFYTIYMMKNTQTIKITQRP
jgi:hypothetical protein